MNSNALFLLIYLIPVLVLVWRIYVKIKEKHFMERTAATLGFTYEPKLPVTTASGNFFTNGGWLLNIISGTVNGLGTRIFNYIFEVGSGKNRHTESFTVFETTYPYSLPHIILMVRGFSNWSTDTEFKALGMDEIKLEGDFSKYFLLYVAKGLEIDAYAVFTPDIMQKFVETVQGLNFEISDHKLSLIKRGLIYQQNEFDKLRTASDFVSTTLLPHFKEMSSDVAAMKEVGSEINS